MSFKYINPGYAELFKVNDGSEDNPAFNIQSEIYNPKNKVSISQNNAWSYIPYSVKKELCIKFDFFQYTESTINNFYVGSHIRDATDNLSWFDGLRIYESKFRIVNKGYSINEAIPVQTNTLYSIWLYFNKNDEVPYVEMIIKYDGKEIMQKYNLRYIYDFTENSKKILFIISRVTAISNIIVSDEYFSPKEEVIILPTNEVETNMTNNQDGTYTANEEGEMILQTVDAKELITKYGKNSKITSIASAGVPAYATAAGLSNLIGIDKINGQLTEHNVIAVSSSTDSGVLDCWYADTTIEKLDGKQIGWKAAT